MKNITFLFILFVMGCKCQQSTHKAKANAVENSVTLPETPKCIWERVALFKKQLSCKSGSKVTAYLFQNKMVYLFEEGPCGADMTAPLYDENCHKLGDLGGIVGNTQINGTNFSTATLQKVVWEQKK